MLRNVPNDGRAPKIATSAHKGEAFSALRDYLAIISVIVESYFLQSRFGLDLDSLDHVAPQERTYVISRLICNNIKQQSSA